MLYRLARPMRRKGSLNAYFEQRIPADVRDRAIGHRLGVPCGETTVSITIGERTNAVRFSYRTADPTEVKVRHGERLNGNVRAVLNSEVQLSRIPLE